MRTNQLYQKVYCVWTLSPVPLFAKTLADGI